MSDLLNLDKLDEGAERIFYPTALPSGERLEDDFGGSAYYPAAKDMNDFDTPVVPIIEVIGGTVYEVTPYGYTLKDNTDSYSNLSGKEKREEKKKEREERRAEAKEERKHLKGFQKILNIGQKYNPAAVIPRAGVLAGMRLNLFGISRRIYPAFLSEEELKAKHYDLENAKHAKKLWDDKFKNVWIDLGGRTLSLKDAIMKGFDKPIFNTKKVRAAHEHEKNGVDGVSEYSNATGYDDSVYVTAGLAIAGELLNVLKQSKVAKNPYAQGTDAYNKTEADNDKADKNGDTTAPPTDPEELRKIHEAGLQDKAKGGDPNSYEPKIFGMTKPVAIGVGLFVLTALVVSGIFIAKHLKNKKLSLKK